MRSPLWLPDQGDKNASSTFPRSVTQLDEFQDDFMGLTVPRSTSSRRIAIWATGGAPSVLATLCLQGIAARRRLKAQLSDESASSAGSPMQELSSRVLKDLHQCCLLGSGL